MYSLSNVIGNKTIVENLRQSIAVNHTPHALIFSGEVGLGKGFIAKSFAKTLQCKERVNGDCCNVCVSCKTFESGNHPDVVYVLPEKTKALGVNDIRSQVTSVMEVRPYEYPYKIFIIKNAHTMTEAAQNALLKTIEEPASFGVFVLLCDNHSLLLPTVLSRCVLFKVKPLLFEEVFKRLRKVQNEQDSTFFASLSNGNLGRGLSLINDTQFIKIRTRAVEIAIQTENIKPTEIFNLLKEFDGFKDRIGEVLDVLQSWFRDLAVYKETQNVQLILQKDLAEQIQNVAKTANTQTILNKCTAINKAKEQLAQNGNFQLVVLILLLSLKEN